MERSAGLRPGRVSSLEVILAIVLEPYGDESRVHERDGNPQRLSHNAETAENPRRVWTFKKLEPPLRQCELA
jgi:hypothetical protein